MVQIHAFAVKTKTESVIHRSLVLFQTVLSQSSSYESSPEPEFEKVV